jgi:choline dehydrogenase
MKFSRAMIRPATPILIAFIRAHAESAYHPCGTMRMGAADDPLAVVDPDM